MPHILLIDDESSIRELLQEMLVPQGYRVTGVESALEASAVFSADPPDLIITDLQLEETDGFAVIDQAKAVLPDTPIILLTGVLFDRAVIMNLHEGKIAAYLEKTTPLQEILAEIRRHLPSN